MKLNNQKKIILVLVFMSLSIGLWSNFRQLWLQSNMFDLTSISSLISVGMFCSCFMALFVSLFSTKVKIKEVLVLTASISIISLIGIMFCNNSDNNYLIKMLVLLTIITENIFWIGIYPLFTTISKTGEMYAKKTIIQNISKDSGILLGGLIVGKTIGNILLDYNTCIFLSIILSMISLAFLLSINYVNDNKNKLETRSLKESLKHIFDKKILRLYFLYVLFVNTAWDVMFGLQMLLFTDKFNYSDSFSSVLILVFGLLASFISIFVLKKIKFKNNYIANVVKFSPRLILYILVIITNNMYIAISAIIVTILTCRICSDYTDGRYVNLVDDDCQFIFSNFRFFMVLLGSSTGIFMAGYILKMEIRYLFLVAFIFTFATLVISKYISSMYDKINKNN